MPKPRYMCIHGHFYQPPRENPWLDAVEVQDSASPYHDWNERITRECYGPNTRSRILDEAGKIVTLLNNFAHMSFNFGPTLLSWLKQHAPDVLNGLIEADRVSRERHRGHGNALAQVYNHVIMPLASERDKKTQIYWGIVDFRQHFGRDPEGMWLAETAVDTSTLEALASAGIKFTILAPRQARRWRQLGERHWHTLGVDPTRAYLCRLPSGRSIHVFFYDGHISQQVAFERLLDNGEVFFARLLNGYSDEREHAQLMHIATDGESYGHHHHFGDMALAYVLNKFARHPDIRLTNYGEYLELHPAEYEVEIHENSSWSCVHGVERWRSDCGCKMRGDWQQQWRGPMRAALDHLKDRVDQLFATRGRQCFPKPWEARDAYIDVILDRSEGAIWRFFAEHGFPDLDDLFVRDGLWLLEMQRNALLMYTSCGWFFDDISGLESTQCLRYAARALQLAAQLGRDVEPEFVQMLAQAPSNLPMFEHGGRVWERLIQPWQVDLERVLAHYAISLIYKPRPQREQVYCFDMEAIDQETHTRGGNHIAIGWLRVRSRTTWHADEANFVVIHYGGLDFYTVLRKAASASEYEAFKKRFLDTYRNSSLADVTALVAREFNGKVHRVDDLFLEEQRRVIGIVLQDRFEDYLRMLEKLAGQDEDVLTRLGHLGYPIPKPMRAAASACLDHRLRAEIAALETNGNLSQVRALIERGRPWGYVPERDVLAKLITEALSRLLQGLSQDTDTNVVLAHAGQILEAAYLLNLQLDLWHAQNQVLEAYASLETQNALTPNLRSAFAELARKLRIHEKLLGWRP